MRQVKSLIIGPPGSGKTSLLAQLANAGYVVHVADFDGGALPLQTYAPDAQYHITPMLDKLAMSVDTLRPEHPVRPKVYPEFVNMMQRDWDGRPLKQYGLKHIFVVDSLSALSMCIFHFSMWQNGRGGKRPHPRDYDDAGIRLEAFCQQVASAPVNFLVLAHFLRLTPGMSLDDDKDAQEKLPATGELFQRYPYVVGRKLPPRIGGYFPTVLHSKRKGEGKLAKRLVGITPVSDAEVKCPLPADARFPDDVPAADFPKLFATLGGYTVEDIKELPDEAGV